MRHRLPVLLGTVVVLVLSAACTPSNPATSGTPGSGSTKPAVKELPAGLSRLPLPTVPAAITRSATDTVAVTLETKSVTALLDDKVAYEFWTFDGTVPGTMIRCMVGDTVELTLKNSLRSPITHSIDSHGITGPGGGAKHTQVAPGHSATIKVKAMNPGVYVYHCATPMIPHHIAMGMYGLMVVEPTGGYSPVDKEFYVMQGDMYLKGERGQEGLHEASIEKLRLEHPDYVVFNGSKGSMIGDRALKASVGDRVRIFFGVGGPNLISSFHVIGEIFDKVFPEGGFPAVTDVQSTLVPAGGSAVTEFKIDVPGDYILVDHSLGRMEKGAVGIISATGSANPDVYEVIQEGTPGGGGH